jgi:hypothetical protein
MSEYWTEKDIMENAILDLQHERDDLQAELARRDASLLTEGEQKEILSYIRGNYDRDKIPCWLLDLIDGVARRDEIITRLKDVLPTLKISHNYCEDCWYSCPKHEDGCCNEAEGEDCNCGADEHNAIIDALMKELDNLPQPPEEGE